MEKILSNLPKGKKDENLIVGFDTKDDAAVYKIDDKHSIIETLDFFPPMIEDPYLYGQIAAVNALSDIWAMGGKPIMALNIFCAPQDVDDDTLGKILKGGADKVLEAGATLCGGHTISDENVKYGLSVTGIVDTDKIKKNNSVRPGDKLILTKPLGVGIILTAANCGVVKKEDYDLAIKQMTTINKYAAEILSKYDVSALTDVTGFGFFNHLDEMLGGKHKAKIYYDKLPMVSENVINYIKDEYTTGGGRRNEEMNKYECDPIIKALGNDPQTSGGLLAAVNPKDAEKALTELNKLDIKSSIVGEIGG